MRMNHVVIGEGMSMDLGEAWEENTSEWEVVSCLLNCTA